MFIIMLIVKVHSFTIKHFIKKKLRLKKYFRMFSVIFEIPRKNFELPAVTKGIIN